MKPARNQSAFTLIEMLMVIAIVALLAAMAVPALNAFRQGDVMVTATRQLLDDVERARQLAINQRTTVYMVFCPTNSETDPNLLAAEVNKAKALRNKQYAAYTYVTRRSVGDQPGQPVPRYLSPWRSLPDGVFIPMYKFGPRTVSTPIYDPPLPAAGATVRFQVQGFAMTNSLPFPSAEAYTGTPGQLFPNVYYIAFNNFGGLESKVDEYIPIARGQINQSRDANGNPTGLAPWISESPPGNSTNAFYLIHIDALTGRARLEKQEMR